MRDEDDKIMQALKSASWPDPDKDLKQRILSACTIESPLLTPDIAAASMMPPPQISRQVIGMLLCALMISFLLGTLIGVQRRHDPAVISSVDTNTAFYMGGGTVMASNFFKEGDVHE